MRDAFDIDWGSRNNVVAFNYGHASKGYGGRSLELTNLSF